MLAVRRPALRYHGGKWMLAPWIIEHLPQHRIFVESFGGGASILIRKPRSYAEIYNDLDGEIVNLFQVLRDKDQACELTRLLRLTPFARAEFEMSYISTHDPIEQARRTIARSLMGFGTSAVGKWRIGFSSNSNRSGTSPAHDWANYPAGIEVIAQRLQGVVIENRPAADVILHQDGPQTLHYIDPPYPFGVRGKWSEGAYRHEMTDDEHRQLAEVLRGVAGMVVISGYPCALYDDELYPGWRRVTKATHADGARDRTEVLWLNPAAQRGSRQLRLAM